MASSCPKAVNQILDVSCMTFLYGLFCIKEYCALYSGRDSGQDKFLTLSLLNSLKMNAQVFFFWP